jgi:hypothetical protein
MLTEKEINRMIKNAKKSLLELEKKQNRVIGKLSDNLDEIQKQKLKSQIEQLENKKRK